VNKKLNHLILLFISIITLDLLSKQVALGLAHKAFQITPGFDFLNFEFILNKGIAFSLLSWLPQNILSFLIVVILGLFFFYSKQQFDLHKNIIPEVMILAGGIGNLISRMLHSGVVDFLEIKLLGLSSSVFNIADVFITIGIILIYTRKSFEIFRKH
jgi:signal peptidase II